MLDDSITSSPSKQNKSIRDTRLKRKKKRKYIEHSEQANSDLGQSCNVFHTLLNQFYEDSDDDESVKNKTSAKKIKPAIISNFKPFELEKSLAMADHLGQQNDQNKTNKLTKTQEFIIFKNIVETDVKTDYSKTKIKENDKNSLSTITESELVGCCHQAEKILETKLNSKKQDNANSNDELTSKEYDNIKLVNSILDDFSQSPLRKEQIVKSTFWQYTPEFRLRKRPTKNYSRSFLNRTRRNLNQRYEEDTTREYNEDHSNSSLLSIQEDVAVDENISNQTSTTNPNKTQRLCENLLNLSEYFTQNQLFQIISNKQQQQNINELNLRTSRQNNYSPLHNMPDLIGKILNLRANPNENIYDSYNSIDDFYGFPDNADINENQQIIMNSNLYKTNDVDVCDIGLPDISINKDDYMSESDSDNILACINTENILQERNNEIKNIENEHQILVQIPASVNSVGFKTASAKTIKVSRHAQEIAAKILNNLPAIPAFEKNTHLNNCDTNILSKEINFFKNPEQYEWNDDCDLLLNFQTPTAIKENLEIRPKKLYNDSELIIVPTQRENVSKTPEMPTVGFKTANGKNVLVSKKAQKSVQHLLNEFVGDLKNDSNYEEELKEIKNKVYEKVHNPEVEQLSTIKLKQLQPDLGCNTAKNENVAVFNSTQETGKNMLREFNLISSKNYKDLEKVKPQICLKNNENIQLSAEFHAYKNIDATKFSQKEITKGKHNMGFHTAKGEIINVSTKAKKSVQKLLVEIEKNNKEDIVNNLKSIRNDINKKNNKRKVTGKNTNISENSFYQSNEDLTLSQKLIETGRREKPTSLNVNEEGNPLDDNMNIGFKTANGKKAFSSIEAKQTVKTLFEEFDNFLDIEQYENKLKEIKMKDLKPVKDKRKQLLDSSDLDSHNKTPPNKIFRHGVHSSSSLSSERSPKTLATSAKTNPVILRKNLLSLSKIRKSKRNSLTVPNEEIPKINKDVRVNTETPVKSCKSLIVTDQTPATPNLKDFFTNAPLTSTPRTNNPLSQDIEGLTWKNNNGSIRYKPTSPPKHTTKLSDNSALNITFNSSNPTAEERIGRLKMYGKAPDVSPILIETHHNCRPSGLRRTRSMTKKTEK